MKIKDYTNQIKGNLKAIKLVKSIKGRTYWEFLCKCGNIKVLPAFVVFRKRKPQTSCGCYYNHFLGLEKGKKYNHLTILYIDNKLTQIGKYKRRIVKVQCDCGKIKELYYFQIKKMKSCGCQSFHDKPYKKKKRYYGYKYSAKERGLEFTLEFEDFCKLTEKNCYYCNSIPKTKIFPEAKSLININNYYNGLDRINNEKGYIIDNLVTCCIICNRAKCKLTYYEWIDYLNNLTNYRKNLSKCLKI